jgi:hypothetical protein
MSSLLEKALENVTALSPDEHDAFASQILACLVDEEAWKKRFAEKRDVIRRMAREAIEEEERARRCRWPIPFDAVANDSGCVKRARFEITICDIKVWVSTGSADLPERVPLPPGAAQ